MLFEFKCSLRGSKSRTEVYKYLWIVGSLITAFFIGVQAQGNVIELCQKVGCKQGELCDTYKHCASEKTCTITPICLPVNQSCFDHPCNNHEACELQLNECTSTNCVPVPSCVADHASQVRFGICPDPGKNIGPCILACKTNAQCPELMKCCPNGCGLSCMQGTPNDAPTLFTPAPRAGPPVLQSTAATPVAAQPTTDQNKLGPQQYIPQGVTVPAIGQPQPPHQGNPLHDVINKLVPTPMSGSYNN